MDLSLQPCPRQPLKCCMGCSAGGAAPVSLTPVQSHSQAGPGPCKQQGIAGAAFQNCALQHGLPSPAGQPLAANTTSGANAGNGTGSSMHAVSGNVRQMQRPRTNGFMPPRKFVAPQASKAAIPQPCPSQQQPTSRALVSQGHAARLPAASKPQQDAYGGSSFSRTHLTHGAATRAPAAVKPDPDASGGVSSPASGAPEQQLTSSTLPSQGPSQGDAAWLPAAGNMQQDAYGGSSFSRTHLTHGSATRPPAAVKPDPDAFAGGSSLASGAPKLSSHWSRSSASPASPHVPQQQSAKVCQPGHAQRAAAKPASSSAERKQPGFMASSAGQGQAAQNRAAAGLPFARRRLVKAGQLPLPDTQVYEHPRSSPPFHPTSPTETNCPSSTEEPCEARARRVQSERSPVMSPQDRPAEHSPCRRFSPGAMPGKRQKHGSEMAGNACQSPGLSRPAEDSGTSAAPGSPAMSGTGKEVGLIVVKNCAWFFQSQSGQ